MQKTYGPTTDQPQSIDHWASAISILQVYHMSSGDMLLCCIRRLEPEQDSFKKDQAFKSH